MRFSSARDGTGEVRAGEANSVPQPQDRVSAGRSKQRGHVDDSQQLRLHPDICIVRLSATATDGMLRGGDSSQSGSV